MNYKNIYDNFIEDRKNKLIIYNKESHHIVPKCMGGTNEKHNLINLSYEDHFFAHLLLAKAYEKHAEYSFKLWTVIKLMAGDYKPNTPRMCRYYAIMRGQYIDKISGDNNPMTDKTNRKWKHKDGAEFEGTNSQLKTLLGTDFDLGTIVRKSKSNYKGWYLEEQYDVFPSRKFLRELRNSPTRGKSNKTYSLKNKEGDVITGTNEELSQIIGCDNRAIQKVYTKQKSHIFGWIPLDQSFDVVKRVYNKTYKIIKNDEFFEGTMKQISEKIDCSEKSVSKLILGTNKTCKNWRLV